MSLDFQCHFEYREGFTFDLGFTTDSGVTALVGPSGSGKTTALMLIAGLLRPERGRIAFKGVPWVDSNSRTWLRPEQRRIGAVFQDSLLFPHKSVRANLEYGLKRRSDKSAIGFDHVVDVLELADLLERSPHSLSGGQGRRVAIGRALLSGPQLLLLDEPWVGLDEELRERVIGYCQRCIAEWQIPTILVSHERELVTRLADHVVEVGG